jgi:aldose 1-epimerase
MAPYAGRIKDGRFRFDGTAYELPPNNGTHAGHGLVFDVPWQVDGEATDHELTLRTDLDDRWPFGGRVVETVQLSATGLSVSLALSNEERAMPASLGFHPWFRRKVCDENALLTIHPRQRYATAADGFPRLLGKDLGTRPWDDVFENMEEAPTISWGDGPSITLTADSTTWTVYEQRQQAFCVEPLTAPPDTLGTPSAAVIRPGHPLTLTMRITWPRRPAG